MWHQGVNRHACGTKEDGTKACGPEGVALMRVPPRRRQQDLYPSIVERHMMAWRLPTGLDRCRPRRFHRCVHPQWAALSAWFLSSLGHSFDCFLILTSLLVGSSLGRSLYQLRATLFILFGPLLPALFGMTKASLGRSFYRLRTLYPLATLPRWPGG